MYFCNLYVCISVINISEFLVFFSHLLLCNFKFCISLICILVLLLFVFLYSSNFHFCTSENCISVNNFFVICVEFSLMVLMWMSVCLSICVFAGPLTHNSYLPIIHVYAYIIFTHYSYLITNKKVGKFHIFFEIWVNLNYGCPF